VGEPVEFLDVRSIPFVDGVVKLATLREPWATDVVCSVEDYRRAGFGGDHGVVPIARPLSSEDARRPVWNETLGVYLCWREEDKKLPPLEPDAWHHRVNVHPDMYVPPGMIARLK
jgi:hypothetical protein